MSNIQPATKKDLDDIRLFILDAFEDQATRFQQVFATKQDVEEIVDRKINEALKNYPTKEEYFSRMDKLTGEYQKFSTDAPNMSAQISDHEERIVVLESNLNSSI